MSKTTKQPWTEERTQKLLEVVGNETPVSNETVEKAAEALETSTRSVGSKLRNLGMEVAPIENTREKSFSDAEANELAEFVKNNSGQYTYADVAAAVCGGKFNARQVQGKILSLELTDHIKPTPKKEVERKYTEAEEAKIVEMMKKGDAYLEDIAEALGKELNSIRGKCLSLSRTDDSLKIPAQKNHVEKDDTDPLTKLGDKVAEMSVEELATELSKTERGVKSMLTKRGIKCANYDGAAKREKADRKKAESQ